MKYTQCAFNLDLLSKYSYKAELYNKSKKKDDKFVSLGVEIDGNILIYRSFKDIIQNHYPKAYTTEHCSNLIFLFAHLIEEVYRNTAYHDDYDEAVNALKFAKGILTLQKSGIKNFNLTIKPAEYTTVSSATFKLAETYNNEKYTYMGFMLHFVKQIRLRNEVLFNAIDAKGWTIDNLQEAIDSLRFKSVYKPTFQSAHYLWGIVDYLNNEVERTPSKNSNSEQQILIYEIFALFKIDYLIQGIEGLADTPPSKKESFIKYKVKKLLENHLKSQFVDYSIDLVTLPKDSTKQN